MQIFTSKIALGNVITEEQKMIVETMKLEFGVLTDCLNKLRKNEAEKVSLSKIIAENCKLS